MKHRLTKGLIVIIWGILLVTVTPPMTWGEVPQLINYQGYLTNASGNSVPNGNYQMAFAIYASDTASVPLWSESQTVAVLNGIYNVQIGLSTGANPFPDDMFEGQRWLGVTVGNDDEMMPRQILTCTPFAMKAGDADKLEGKAAADFAEALHGHSWSELSDRPVGLDDGDDVGITIENDPTVLSSVKDGVSWGELSGKPAGFADDVDDTGIMTETDPTVPGWLKDGITWGEVSNHPAGLDDGDDVGITSENDPQVGSNSLNRVPKWNGSSLVTGTIFDNGNVGIGTTSPAQKLDVSGRIKISDIDALMHFNETAGGTAEWLVGGAGGDFRIGHGNVVSNNRFYIDGDSGNIGIGTFSPESKLHVVGDAKFNIGSGSITFTTPGGWPGLVYYAPNGHRRDIQFYNDYTTISMSESGEASDPLNGILIRENGHVGLGTTNPSGKLEVVSDGFIAGKFTSNYAPFGTAVLHAEYTGTGYDAVAVYGKSKPRDYAGYGGRFEGGLVGVSGFVAPQGSYSYYGVYGNANGGSGKNYGVWGGAYGGTTNYAGYFSGNAHVTGTLTKAGGSFKIDHPLEPENKYLQHSFVESPDMMNIYNGNVVLDDIGEALVELPDWFEALNRDFRYQLTAIGAPGPNLYIAEEISDNSFRIAGGEGGMKVSWQVTGIRQDPWANANRITVEEDKPASEQDYYLHPEVYGKSREQGMDWASDLEMMEQMKEKLEKSQTPTS